MAYSEGHFRPDGSCACPKDGQCIACGKPCNDHDLLADYWMCGPCLNASFDRYNREEDNTMGWLIGGSIVLTLLFLFIFREKQP